MKKLFNLGNENLYNLIEQLLLYIDKDKIEGVLSITNEYKKNLAIFTLALDSLLLNRGDLLICILKRQIEQGLKANQISTLRILTVFLNDCVKRGYF